MVPLLKVSFIQALKGDDLAKKKKKHTKKLFEPASALV